MFLRSFSTSTRTLRPGRPASAPSTYWRSTEARRRSGCSVGTAPSSTLCRHRRSEAPVYRASHRRSTSCWSIAPTSGSEQDSTSSSVRASPGEEAPIPISRGHSGISLEAEPLNLPRRLRRRLLQPEGCRRPDRHRQGGAAMHPRRLRTGRMQSAVTRSTSSTQYRPTARIAFRNVPSQSRSTLQRSTAGGTGRWARRPGWISFNSRTATRSSAAWISPRSGSARAQPR